MADVVKAPTPSLREAHVAHTERRILDAAARLFLDAGYTETTLAAIAREAGVGARTVYVRFGTKAALFSRVVDVAVVGDAEPVALMDRDWARVALEADTLVDRVTAWAAVARQIMERTGRLFAVSVEAAAVEPDLAELVATGRRQTLEAHHMFWARAADDGLLPEGVDPAWLADTTAVLASAEPYVFVSQLHGWDLDTYESWLRQTLLALASP
ncbi:MAG: TetR/AcrR family transcriptional regulator [Acidimicrobiales bacterium]